MSGSLRVRMSVGGPWKPSTSTEHRWDGRHGCGMTMTIGPRKNMAVGSLGFFWLRAEGKLRS